MIDEVSTTVTTVTPPDDPRAPSRRDEHLASGVWAARWNMGTEAVEPNAAENACAIDRTTREETPSRRTVFRSW